VTRVPALDGVRGLAIALVVAHHAGVLPGGWAGVSLFFTLSGYLITSLLLSEHTRTGTVRLPSFYLRRLIRLAPALVVALVGMVTLWALTVPDQTNLAVADALVTLAYVANIVRALNPAWMVPAGWAWSLSIEEQFYLLWPVTLRAALRRFTRLHVARALLGLVAALTLARLAVGSEYVDYSLLRGDELLLGCALALAPWRPSVHWITAGAVLFVALLAVPEGHFSLTVPLATLGSASVLLLTEHGWFTLAPLRWLGRISYSLYLWNGILVGAWFGAHQQMPHGWAALGITVVSVAVATGSTLWLEEPLRRRLHHPEPVTREVRVAGCHVAVEVEPDVRRGGEVRGRVVSRHGVVPDHAVR
jgi:peptidoglycan/LPS O-acetylase OafA/YrhL